MDTSFKAPPSEGGVDTLYSSLSEIVAHHFTSKQVEGRLCACPPRKVIRVCGLSGISTTKVKDVKVVLSIKEIIRTTLDVPPSSPTSRKIRAKVIKDLQTFEIFTHIRAITTNLISAKGGRGSCETFSIKEDSLTVFVRVDGLVTTQHCRPHFPLFKGDWERFAEIRQGEIAFSSPTSTQPVLGTWHLATCCAIVGYCKTTGIGFLAHVDEITKLFSLFKTIQAKVSKTTTEEASFDIALIGGCEDRVGHSAMSPSYLATLIKKKSTDAISYTIVHQTEESEYLDIQSVMKDSIWSQSTRLARSVAIDLSLEDPIRSLLSYEPYMNSSSLSLRDDYNEEMTAFLVKHRFRMKVTDLTDQ